MFGINPNWSLESFRKRITLIIIILSTNLNNNFSLRLKALFSFVSSIILIFRYAQGTLPIRF